MLFIGAEGLGKKTLALEFAKALLCLNHSGSDSCAACRLMNLEDGNLSHPDFLRVQREPDPKTGRLKDISIEQIKDLIAKSAFAPVMSDTKVCIIEDCDRMSNDAANAFLKILEEPPSGWVMLLLAASEQKLLPTILSRVVRLRFQPVSTDAVEQHLLHLQQMQHSGITGVQAQVLARISEGSVGTALRLPEQDVFAWRQQALAFLEALPLSAPLNYLADRTWQQKSMERPEALLFVKLLQLLLRDLLMCRLNLHDKLYNCDLLDDLLEQSRKWSSSSLKSALADVQAAYAAIDNSTGIRAVLEAMALKIDKAYKE